MICARPTRRGAVTAVGDDKRLIMPTSTLLFSKNKQPFPTPHGARGGPGTGPLASARRACRRCAPAGRQLLAAGCIWACVMGAPPAPWTWDCGTWPPGVTPGRVLSLALPSASLSYSGHP